MAFDPQNYIRHIDHYDISHDQKIELIHILHRMMESFVDRAFGDDPVQSIVMERNAKRALESATVIDCENYPNPVKTITGTFTETSANCQNKEESKT